MSNLLVDDENVKSSRSNFAIYENETIKFEGKDISSALFSYKLQSGFFQSIDIEIINAVSLLKYSTSRQITTFLNSVRNIEVDQNIITKRLTKLNYTSVIGRYSFTSDDRPSETGLKCYVLRDRGKRLLLQREYKCKWDVFNSVLILENIKNYLARNNFLLKLLKNKIIDFANIKLNNDDNMVNCNFKVSEYKYTILTMRKTDSAEQLKKIIIELEKNSFSLNQIRFIIIGEDDSHLFELFKSLLYFIKKKEINHNYLNSTFFTQDLRIIERNVESCFVIYKINNNVVTLEDVCFNELKENLEK